MVSNTLRKVYGAKIKYFQKTTQSRDIYYRLVMCDLAVHDLNIVLAHANNKIVIKGRYHVTFRASFFVEAPVRLKEIVGVFEPDSYRFDFKPEIDLYTWL